MYAAAPRAVAFRCDREGITLGALPRNLTRRRRAAVFVPWADVYYQHAAEVCQGGPIGWERVGSARPHLPAVGGQHPGALADSGAEQALAGAGTAQVQERASGQQQRPCRDGHEVAGPDMGQRPASAGGLRCRM